MYLRIFKYPRPSVAAVNGHAIAGGLITALNCDFRVAARKPVKFGLNEVPLGIPMPSLRGDHQVRLGRTDWCVSHTSRKTLRTE
jgi:enoyl-CoA hydratase/carnithine racemase